MLDNLINQYKPHFQSAAEVCRGYADRCLVRLDMIYDALQEEDFQEVRRKFPVASAGAGTVDVATVPTGQTWEIEVVTFDANAVGALALLVDGIAVIRGNFTTVASNVICLSGQVITFRADAAASAYVQVKIHRMREGKRTNHTGSPIAQQTHVATDLDPDPKQEAELTGRHAAPGVYPAANVHGEKHRNGSGGPLTKIF